MQSQEGQGTLDARVRQASGGVNSLEASQDVNISKEAQTGKSFDPKMTVQIIKLIRVCVCGFEDPRLAGIVILKGRVLRNLWVVDRIVDIMNIKMISFAVNVSKLHHLALKLEGGCS